jgi:hypothetical protein
MEKPFCVKCDRARLPSSSNAKFDFDYCTGCKQMSTFVAQAGAGGAGASLEKQIHKKTDK